MTFAASAAFRPHSTDDRIIARDAIARIPLFGGLSLGDIVDLADRMVPRRVRARAIVASQHEPGDALFVIVSGRIRSVIFGENRSVTVAEHGAGETFGESSLFEGAVRPTSCVAVERSHLLVLSLSALHQHCGNHPKTAIALIDQMSRRLNRAEEFVGELALYDVQERLVHQLIVLAVQDETEDPEGLVVRRRPSQQDLANMIGTCRETASRAFHRLARDGAIIVRGDSLVVTHALLRKGTTP